jgi:hypothetical protein
VRFVGFTSFANSPQISDVRVSYLRADFAQIEVPQFELYGAKWLEGALPPRMSFDRIALQWRHNGSTPQSTTLLSPSRNFGGSGDPHSIMVTTHGWGNTMSCISLYTGWTSGGEACSIGSGNAVASSTSASAGTFRDQWLTFERTVSDCAVAVGTGTIPGDLSTVIVSRMVSLSACPDVREIGFTTHLGTASDAVVAIDYTQRTACNNTCPDGGIRNDVDCSCTCLTACAAGGTLQADCSCEYPLTCTRGGVSEVLKDNIESSGDYREGVVLEERCIFLMDFFHLFVCLSSGYSGI